MFAGKKQLKSKSKLKGRKAEVAKADSAGGDKPSLYSVEIDYYYYYIRDIWRLLIE